MSTCTCKTLDCCNPADDYTAERLILGWTGDYGTNDGTERDVAQLIKTHNVEAIMAAGGNNYVGSYPNAVQWYGDFLNASSFHSVLGPTDWDVANPPHDYLAYFSGAVKTAIRSKTGGIASITTATAHGLANSDWVTVLDVGGTGYNGQLGPIVVTGATTFTYPITDLAFEAPTADIGGYVQIIPPPFLGVQFQRYYVRHFPVADFFMLDGGYNSAGAMLEPDGNTIGSVQYQWLQYQLGISTAPWKIAVLHPPPYSSGNNQYGGWPALRWDFGPLGLDLVLSAFEDSYERLIVGGVPYIVQGLGGRAPTGFGPPVAGSQFRYNAKNGYSIFDIAPKSLTQYFYSLDGTLIDTFALTK